METINTFIHILSFYLIFEMYVKGVGGVLVARYTDENAEELGASHYYLQVMVLTMFCAAMCVDVIRHIG